MKEELQNKNKASILEKDFSILPHIQQQNKTQKKEVLIKSEPVIG